MAPGPLSSARVMNDETIPLLDNSTTPPIDPAQAAEPVAATRATGYAFMACSALCHALMSFFIRVAEASYNYPSISCVIIRACTSIALSILYLAVHRLFHTVAVSKKHLLLLTFRGIFGASSGVCTFYALQYLPVGIAITILYASPAITSVLAAIFLRDSFTLAHVLTLVLNFTGVTLTSRGSYTSHEAINQYVFIGIAYAILAALSASIVFVLVRAMGLRVHFVLGCLYYGFGCVFIALVLGTRDDVLAIRYNKKGTIFALLSGFAGFGSQSMLTRGLQIITPGPAAVVRSLNVPISFLLGLAFLSEKPSHLSLIGVALVLASIASVAWQKKRVSPSSPSQQAPARVERGNS